MDAQDMLIVALGSVVGALVVVWRLHVGSLQSQIAYLKSEVVDLKAERDTQRTVNHAKNGRIEELERQNEILRNGGNHAGSD